MNNSFNAGVSAPLRWSRLIAVLAALVGLGALQPTPSLAQQVEWRQLQIPRFYSQAMAYDSARNVVVMFGEVLSGTQGQPITGQTWEWDGNRWTQRSVSGPSPRSGHAMAYDSARGVVVLFGGSLTSTGSPFTNQTWEWNGNSWTQRLVSGPAPRIEHAMAYDSARHVTVLFGGYPGPLGSNQLADTWEWDGSTWTQRPVSGPSPRSSHSMTYDTTRHVTVLFGGLFGLSSTLNDETWEWDGTVWTKRAPPSAPAARYASTMTYDPVRQVTVLFGGSHISPTSYVDTWEWNGTTWTRRDIDKGPQISGRIAHDAARGLSVFFPNNPGSSNAETWTWNGVIWRRHPASGAPASIATYDVARDRSVLLGSDGGTWELGNVTWAQILVPGPSARIDHAMAYDSARGVSVLFGGQSTAFVLNAETWEWNGTAWAQRIGSGPSPRAYFAMTFDSDRNVTVLFGGFTGSTSTPNGETWEWDGSAWTQRIVSGPPARWDHAMVYDSVRHVTVLFGGDTGSFPYDSATWEWNGIAWSQRATIGPVRSSHAMAYDSSRNVTVLYGGAVGAAVGDTWEWNGTLWTQRVIKGPSPRYRPSMAYDSAHKATLMFGGSGYKDGGTLWGLFEIICPIDFNRDGSATGDDFDAFVDAFVAGNIAADFNQDGFVTGDDYDAYVIEFEAGC